MAAWKTLSTRTVYQCPWMTVHEDKILNQNQEPKTYSVVLLPHPAVMILATDQDGRILMQQNYRYSVGDLFWELPAGHSDGQDLLVAAKRELLEEAGIESNDWQYLGTTYSALGISNIPMAIYWARSVQLVSDERDEDEDIRNQQFMPPAQIETMAAAGDIVSTGVLSALYLMGLMKEKQ